MTDWKQTLETLERFRPTYRNEYSEVYCRAYDEAIRLCTAAARLPEGVDAEQVLKDFEAFRTRFEELKAERDELQVQVTEWEMTAVREGLLCAGDIES